MLRARSSSHHRAAAGAVVLAIALSAASISACHREASDGPRAAEPVRVAAASDLAIAFKEVAKAFEASSGDKVELTFGSTGLLAKQIAEGAPYDVFAAANVSYADDVARAGACDGSTKREYAKGRIVMWSKDKALLPATVEELRDPKFAKIAIANPEHAPYGLAAEQALEKAGVWSTVKPRLVFGQNVQQTLMFAKSGNAEVAIVALSLAISSGGGYVPVDAALHAPLDQAVVICRGGSKPRATPKEPRAFVDFVVSDAGHAIMRKYGFLRPGEAVPPSR